jgi:hypothetical protein
MFCKPEQVTMSFPFVMCDKALDALQFLKNLEPLYCREKGNTTAPAWDGLTIIIYESVEGNARTVPNGIKNKGWIKLGFLTGAKMKTSEIFIINIHFCLYWYFNNDANTLIR